MWYRIYGGGRIFSLLQRKFLMQCYHFILMIQRTTSACTNTCDHKCRNNEGIYAWILKYHLSGKCGMQPRSGILVKYDVITPDCFDIPQHCLSLHTHRILTSYKVVIQRYGCYRPDEIRGPIIRIIAISTYDVGAESLYKTNVGGETWWPWGTESVMVIFITYLFITAVSKYRIGQSRAFLSFLQMLWN